MMIFFIALVVVVAFIVESIMFWSLIIKADKHINNLYDKLAKASETIAKNQEEIRLLTINTEPEESENEAEQTELQKTLDNRYNEGMDNIFSYTVETGIRTGER